AARACISVKPARGEIASTSVPLCRANTGTGRALAGSKRLELAQEAHLGQLDPKLLAHRGARPADHVIGLVGGGEPIGLLVQDVIGRRPWWQVVAMVDGRLQPGDKG